MKKKNTAFLEDLECFPPDNEGRMPELFGQGSFGAQPLNVAKKQNNCFYYFVL